MKEDTKKCKYILSTRIEEIIYYLKHYTDSVQFIKISMKVFNGINWILLNSVYLQEAKAIFRGNDRKYCISLLNTLKI